MPLAKEDVEHVIGGRELLNFFQEALSQTGLKYEYLKAVVAITWISCCGLKMFAHTLSLLLLLLTPFKVKSENSNTQLKTI